MVASARRWLMKSLRCRQDDGENCEDFSGTGNPHRRNERMRRTSIQQSTTVLKELSDPSSELARLLFVGDSQHEANQGDEQLNSIGTRNSLLYSLALAPVDVRNERIIMLAEAYAIFGALFLGGTWILYEWGSGKAYGEEDVDLYESRYFELVMTLAIICNLLLALFASVFWIMSISLNWSNEDWVYQSRKIMTFCDMLLSFTGLFVGLGIIMGIQSNLRGHTPEIIIATVFYGVVIYGGFHYHFQFQTLILPLEVYHLPCWAKWFSVLTSESRKKLRCRAKLRAGELKEWAYREKLMVDPNAIRGNDDNKACSLGLLLRRAADNLGRSNDDVAMYEARLEADWYNEAEQLKGMSVNLLSNYMPRRLAQEVHDILLKSDNKNGHLHPHGLEQSVR